MTTNNPLQPNGVCDSRDLIEYRSFLEQEILDAYTDWAENHNEHCDEGQEIEIPESFEDIEFLNEEAFTEGCDIDFEHYEAIVSLIEELENYGDFQYGETIIGEDYFEEYCEDFIKDCGFLPRDLHSLIENNIDWKGIADDMRMDYTTVSFDGDEYLMRA